VRGGLQSSSTTSNSSAVPDLWRRPVRLVTEQHRGIASGAWPRRPWWLERGGRCEQQLLALGWLLCSRVGPSKMASWRAPSQAGGKGSLPAGCCCSCEPCDGRDNRSRARAMRPCRSHACSQSLGRGGPAAPPRRPLDNHPARRMRRPLGKLGTSVVSLD
jgi:hypothetical protein